MEIKEIVAAICSAMISLGFLWILAPEGRMKRSAEVAFGIAALLSVAIPFAGGINMEFSINQSAEQTMALKETADTQIISAAESQVISVVSRALQESEINYSNISAFMDINDDGSISIECVRIIGVAEEKKEVAEKIIIALLGVDPLTVEVKDE